MLSNYFFYVKFSFKLIKTNMFLLTGRLELLRLPDRGAVTSGAVSRRRVRPVNVAFLPSAQSLQTRQVLEIPQRHPDHYG